MSAEYVIRVEGTAGHYGLGETISPGVAFFKVGRYGLSKDELKAAILATTVTKSVTPSPSGRTQHGVNRNSVRL